MQFVFFFSLQISISIYLLVIVTILLFFFFGECNYFFFNVTKDKKSHLDATLVVGISQSIHRLLLLLLLGQCVTVLLSETLLSEGKNQCTLTLLPPRICFSCQWNIHCVCYYLFTLQQFPQVWATQHKLFISHALGVSSMEKVNNRD